VAEAESRKIFVGVNQLIASSYVFRHFLSNNKPAQKLGGGAGAKDLLRDTLPEIKRSSHVAEIPADFLKPLTELDKLVGVTPRNKEVFILFRNLEPATLPGMESDALGAIPNILVFGSYVYDVIRPEKRDGTRPLVDCHINKMLTRHIHLDCSVTGSLILHPSCLSKISVSLEGIYAMVEIQPWLKLRTKQI
jgi:hypothetical protein